jgi:hypothetical protein
MGPIQVVVQDGNNLVLEVTPTADTTVILDRGIAGPAGVVWRGNWSSATAYVINDGVYYAAGNASYVCILANTNQLPTNATYWQLLVSGAGNVTGAASSTDNAVVRFDGTTGKLIQNSLATISDTGTLTAVDVVATSNPLVQQSDIGSAPNEIPLNQYLGNLAYQDAANIAGPVGIGGALTVVSSVTSGSVVVTDNSINSAMRITQLGTGNALLVEDSANPDATPFVVTNTGVIVGGNTLSLDGYAGVVTQQTSTFEAIGGNSAGTGLAIFGFSTATASPRATVNFNKSQSTTIGTQTIVTSNEVLGGIHFNGSDGTNYIPAAQIYGVTDGTPGTNDMPGRLVFSTTVDGASTPTERVRIDNAGNVQASTGAIVQWSPTPAAINAASTLTNANIQSQIINTTGTTYTVTMPLGTTMETLIPWGTVNLGYNFSVINTASGIITMAVNTGVTSLGSLVIAIGASAQFRIRRTAANTFILYRLS